MSLFKKAWPSKILGLRYSTAGGWERRGPSTSLPWSSRSLLLCPKGSGEESRGTEAWSLLWGHLGNPRRLQPVLPVACWCHSDVTSPCLREADSSFQLCLLKHRLLQTLVSLPVSQSHRAVGCGERQRWSQEAWARAICNGFLSSMYF